MASIREAFTNPDVAQDEFVSAQRIRYTEVEPHRFLSDSIKGDLGTTIPNDMNTHFTKYDPYTQTQSTKFSASGMKQILQGQAPTTDEETYCRGFTGASSIPKLQSDQESEGNPPVRCGWRYKRAPGGGLPLVSQGALGTKNGPLNTKVDRLGNGVEWIWDLNKAFERHAKDFRSTLPASSAGLTAAQRVFPNTAWCSQTRRFISLDRNGNPLPGSPCGRANIVTNPAQFPTASLPTVAARFSQANTTAVMDCMRPGNNPSLSRDCLLKAITMNGCSTDGALYQAIEAAKPTANDFSRNLQQQQAFRTYQSKQGSNKLTSELFKRTLGTWDMAERDIQNLQKATQAASDPTVKVAARDLCIGAGSFETHDFCADLQQSANIQSVDLKCMQSYWQEQNGKPAGLLYPSRLPLKQELGVIRTWGEYRNAVDQLKLKTASSNPQEQRLAMNQFLGVSVTTQAFRPTPIGGQSAVLWVDAKDGGSITMDESNRVRSWGDKSGRNNSLLQTAIPNRPIYKQEAFPGIEFDGANSFMPIPNADQMVTGNFIVFVVEKRKSSKTQNYFLAGNSVQPNSNLVLGYRFPTTATMAFWSNDVNVTVPGYKLASEPMRIWAFEKTNTGRSIYVNGERIGGDTSFAGLTGWSGASVGGLSAYSIFYNGIVYEILIYSSDMSIERRQMIEGYLAHKWGLANDLPLGHPYKLNSP